MKPQQASTARTIRHASIPPTRARILFTKAMFNDFVTAGDDYVPPQLSGAVSL
ncbi:hypothetical protein FRB96_008451, partial [Tulasnella sp. 330]